MELKKFESRFQILTLRTTKYVKALINQQLTMPKGIDTKFDSAQWYDRVRRNEKSTNKDKVKRKDYISFVWF